MRNRAEYKTVKAKVNELNLTLSQVQNLTIEQVLSEDKIKSDTGKETKSYWPGIKALLIREMQQIQDRADEQEIKDTLDTGFPDWKDTKMGSELNDKLSVAEVL